MQVQPAGTARWQRLLARAYTDIGVLLGDLGLSADDLPGMALAARPFPLRVPRGYVAKMRHGDPSDPLLRQVLPIVEETVQVPGFVGDPVGDGAAEAVPGVLHKYQGRALFITTGACAVHCRYCFRRQFPYADSHAAANAWRPALEYLRNDPSIREVILSGGDPLSLADAKLAELARALDQVPHLQRLRLHTRLPIVLPERVDETLLGWLGATRLQRVIVVHANHRNEIDDAVRRSLWRLRDAGITVLNQSVLLAGVNDDVDALCALSEALFDAGTMPYYLHQLDRVAGAAHFEVSDERAVALVRSMRERMPGYLVPTLVRENAGEGSKRPL
jgi:EF-P beta-lysylation protein EpmB